MLANPDLFKKQLASKAAFFGFDVMRVTTPDAIPEAPARLRAFLEKGHHGDMGWMQTHETRRNNPRHLWPDVKSIIMLGMNYGPETDPMENLALTDRGNISVYARGKDYHDVMKKKLKQLARWMLTNSELAHEELKVFVDTAPVMEKPLAASSGLGWQGKHTNLVSRDFGSWLFIGSIFITIDLPADEAEEDHCGSCTACLDVCPTDAFVAPYQLDARKCISYLTIEAKAQVPLEYRSAMGNRIYGCDDCLAVCPWNKYASTSREAKLQARETLNNPPLAELVQLSDAGFRDMFAGSPVKRTGRDRFVRNVLIAIGNMGGNMGEGKGGNTGEGKGGNIEREAKDFPAIDRSLIEKRLLDASALVRGMAVWAIAPYMKPENLRLKAQAALEAETDASVRAEWERYL